MGKLPGCATWTKVGPLLGWRSQDSHPPTPPAAGRSRIHDHPSPPAGKVAPPPKGDGSRRKFPPQWELQRLEKLRVGMERVGATQLRFPLAMSLRAYPAYKGVSGMAADCLLPEGGRERESWTGAAVASHASLCLVQGGGTPGPAKHPQELWQDNAVVAHGATGYGKGRGMTDWDPERIDVRKADNPDQGGQGWWWDWWMIACANGASTAAFHRDAFPELMVQWPASARRGMTYEEARKTGIDMCNRAISAGISATYTPKTPACR